MGDEYQKVIPWHTETKLTRNGGVVESHFWKVINLNGFTYKAYFGASSEIGRGVEIYVTTNENGGILDLSAVGKDNITVNDGEIYKLVKASLSGGGWDVVDFWTPSDIITTGGLITPYVQFDTDATPITNAEGLLQWNATDGTLDLGMLGGDVTQQIGQEMFIKVRNTSGSTILNGTPVYFSGRSGNRPIIEPAISDTHATSIVEGLTTGDIDDNAEGFITTFGYVRQIKTNYSGAGAWGTTWNEGDALYVSKTVAGQLTNIEPSAPHHSDVVGEVGVLGGAGIGSIFVRIDRHQNLEHLSDINGTSLSADGQFPVWNNTAGYFDFDFNINDYASKLAVFNSLTSGYLPNYNGTSFVNSPVYTNGTNVGIGTTTPTQKMHIEGGNILVSGSTIDNGSGLFGNSISVSNTVPNGSSNLALTTPTKYAVLVLYGDSQGGSLQSQAVFNTSADLNFLTDGNVANGGSKTIKFTTGGFTNNPTMIITGGNTGNVGIGTTNPQSKLHIDSSINSTFATFSATGASWGIGLGAEIIPNFYIGASGSVTDNFFWRGDYQDITRPANTFKSPSATTGHIPVGLQGIMQGASVGQETLLRLFRSQTGGVKWGSSAEFSLGTFNTTINAQSQLDINLGNGATDNPDTTVMTLLGNGNVGIGTTTPTALLHLAEGTTTKAPLKFTSGTNLTTPEAGSFEYDGGSFFATPVINRRSIDLSDGVITSDTTVSNTLTETTVFTEPVSANELHVGQMIQTKIFGIYSTANASDTFIARLKIGGVTVDTFTSTAANVTNGAFEIEINSTVRSVGVTGTVMSQAKGFFNGELKQDANIAPATVDTTAADDITLTIEWSSANSGNTLTVQQGLAQFFN
jgi:hypothetical protein